jgi:RHS repeat-associated protein
VYKFNGKEQDLETTGTTTYDYGFRIYNPALGRFLSVDPISKDYPWNSPYSYAEGDVIRSIDLDGKEKAVVTDDGAIEIQLVYVAFTNRPSKVVNGKEYSGGNLPSNLSAEMAVKVFNKGYEEINSELNGKEFAIKPTEFAKPELANGLYFGAKEAAAGDKTYKVRFSAKLLVFTDEDEMRKSNEYQQALVNNTMSGFQLYGTESYATIQNGNSSSEQPLVMDAGAFGQSFGSGTTPNKAILIDPVKGGAYPMVGGNSYYRSTVTHEHGHQLGLPHTIEADPVKGQPADVISGGFDRQHSK